MRKLVLSDEQWERICHHFPEESRPKRSRGRPAVPAREVLDAVLWVLHSGAPWHFLPQCFPNYKTVHRRYQRWMRTGVLDSVLKDLAAEAGRYGLLDGDEAYIDGSFAPAKRDGLEVGCTKAGRA